jgi:Domain of unknown function (DUF5658)
MTLERFRQHVREHRWFFVLGLMWLFLSLFDLAITFWALSTGRATEANPLMARVMHDPLLATTTKLGLVYLALKVAEVIYLRARIASIPVLAFMNLHIGLTCLNNVLIVAGLPLADYLRIINPLG